MERGRVFFYFYTFLSRSPCLPFFPANHKKKRKTKTKKLFPHNGVRSWLAYPESLRFQVFSLFLICRDRTRCTTKSMRSREDKKKKISLTVSDLPRSHKVYGKEHTQSGKETI